MNIELRHLKILVTLADAGSVGRAAKELNIAQPNLSRLLSRIEELLGAELFHRTTRGVALTSQGVEAVSRARVVLNLAAEIPAAVAQAGNRIQVRTSFYVGFQKTIPLLHERFRDRLWTFTEMEPEDAAADVSAGRAQLFAAVRWPYTPAWKNTRGLSVIEVYTSQVCMYVSADHPSVMEDSVDLTYFEDENWIVNPDISVVAMECTRAGFMPKITWQSRDESEYTSLIGSGQAVSMTMARWAPSIPAGLRAVRYRGAPSATCEIYFDEKRFPTADVQEIAKAIRERNS